MDYPFTIFRTTLLLIIVVATSSCASLGFEPPRVERYLACPQDTVWKEAIATLKEHPGIETDKEDGLIETDWQEQVPKNRPYGLFGRDALGDKERARLTFFMKPIGEGVVFVTLTERRQHWGFTGGAQIYRWAPMEPSQEILNGIMNRLTAQLGKEGCIIES